jgi:hypothetical protein
MKTIVAGLVLVAGLIAFAESSAATVDSGMAHKEIGTLVKTFQASISAKDGDRLEALFLPQGSNWWSVLDDATYATVKLKRPDASRTVPGDLHKFATFIKTTTHVPREDFNNVRIQTDGMVGTVYFDYAFFLDNKQTNHGVETWQLVRTDAGWKISALLYSEIHDKAN